MNKNKKKRSSRIKKDKVSNKKISKSSNSKKENISKKQFNPLTLYLLILFLMAIGFLMIYLSGFSILKFSEIAGEPNPSLIDLSQTDTDSYWFWDANLRPFFYNPLTNKVYTFISNNHNKYNFWAVYDPAIEEWGKLNKILPLSEGRGAITEYSDGPFYYEGDFRSIAPKLDESIVYYGAFSGEAGELGYYNLTSNRITTLIEGEGVPITTIALDPTNTSIYFGNVNGEFLRYSITSNNTTIIYAPWDDYLTDLEPDNWIAGRLIRNIQMDPLRNLVYVFDDAYLHGVYDPTTNILTDLDDPVELNPWSSGERFPGKILDYEKNILYLATYTGKFAAYNLSAEQGSRLINLNETDPDNWAPAAPTRLFLNKETHEIYTFANHSLGVYNPDTNVWTKLSSSSLEEFLIKYPIYDLSYSTDLTLSPQISIDYENNLLYIGGKDFFIKYDLISGEWTNLANLSYGDWQWEYNTLSLDVADNGKVYTAGESLKLGEYNPSSNVWTDKSSVIFNNITSPSSYPFNYPNITSVEIDNTNNLAYLSFEKGNFGFYNLTSNTFTDLSNTDTANWAGTTITVKDLALDPNTGIVYTLGGNLFGKYNLTSNVWSDLSASDTGNWMGASSATASDAYEIEFNPADNRVYLTLPSVGFGVYNSSSGVTSNLYYTAPSTWFGSRFSNQISGLEIDSLNNLVYTSFENGQLGVYNPTLNQWNYLNTYPYYAIGGQLSFITDMVLDSEKNLLYVSLKSVFHNFTLAAYSLDENVWIDLSHEDEDNWIDESYPTSLALDSINNKLYLGISEGKFGVYNLSNESVYVNSHLNNSLNPNPDINISCFGFSDKGITEMNLYLNDILVDNIALEDLASYSHNFTRSLEDGIWKVKCSIINSEDLEVNSTSIYINQTRQYPTPIIERILFQYPLAPTDNLIATARYSIENETELGGNAYFKWYVNGINIENDTIEVFDSSSDIVTYLNYSFDSGDLVNASLIITNGEYNSSLYSSYFIMDYPFLIHTKLSSLEIEDVECDDTYCYASNAGGYFLKINHQTGEHIYNHSFVAEEAIMNELGTDYIESIFCDDTYCYAAGWDGYFSKINHQTGEHVFSPTSIPIYFEDPNYFSNDYLSTVKCDETYCYVSTEYGYFLKINKISGEVVFNNTEDYLWHEYGFYNYRGMDCDDTYCYASDADGYFLKINHQTGEQIYNYTESGDTSKVNQFSSLGNFYGGFDCDENYCYTMDSDSSSSLNFFKLNKTDGSLEVNYETPVPHFATILYDTYNSDVYSMFCDEDYCYTATGEYLVKVSKANGSVLYSNFSVNFVDENYFFETYNSAYSPFDYPYASHPYVTDIDCDDTSCYIVTNDGYFLKKEKNVPEIYFEFPVEEPPEDNQTEENQTDDNSTEDNSTQEILPVASGGSGGGTTSSNLTNITNTTEVVNETELEDIKIVLDFEDTTGKGYTGEFEEQEAINFTSFERKNYTLKIEKISATEVKFRIPYTNYSSLILKKGSSKKLSLTPNYYDLLLKVNAIEDSKKVSLTMQGILERIVDSDISAKSSDLSNDISSNNQLSAKGKVVLAAVTISLFALIIGLVILFLIKRKKVT